MWRLSVVRVCFSCGLFAETSWSRFPCGSGGQVIKEQREYMSVAATCKLKMISLGYFTPVGNKEEGAFQSPSFSTSFLSMFPSPYLSLSLSLSLSLHNLLIFFSLCSYSFLPELLYSPTLFYLLYYPLFYTKDFSINLFSIASSPYFYSFHIFLYMSIQYNIPVCVNTI